MIFKTEDEFSISSQTEGCLDDKTPGTNIHEPERGLRLLEVGLYRFVVSVLVSGQYQHFLMVSESVKYVVQVPILLFVYY